MPELIQFEQTVELPHPPEAVWPILSKTDWLNRAAGLPPVTYNITARKEGGSHVMAQASIFGIRFQWQELPFEWTEPKFHKVRRVFDSGPFIAAEMGFRFRPTASGGCAVTVFSRIEPRNFFGEFLAKRILVPKTTQEMGAAVLHAGEHLSGRKRAVLPKLATHPVNSSLLAEGVRKLQDQGQPNHLVSRLAGLIREGADVEMVHIRPFTLAREWGENRWQVLSLFLHATRAGLVNLGWEILCPNCRSSRTPPDLSLSDLSRTSHCEVCNIKFDAEFDKSVELKFSVHPSIRTNDLQTFCLAGPGGKPHIVSQIVLEAGQRRVWDIPDLSRPYRLRSLQVKEPVTLTPDDGPAPLFDAVIVCNPECFNVRFEYGKQKDCTVQVFNPSSYPIELALEKAEWDEDILTAARVTNLQEFRDLFAREVVSPGEQVTVGSQVVLFTDLRGSTNMYNNLGDAPAYCLVRDHFKVLRDSVAEHHGALVKTIGDAVMAVFSDLGEALAAVKQMHDRLPLANPDPRVTFRLHLKSALHAGPCLAVNANERLDFFGTTINLAARLVDYCQGDDLTLSDELYQRPATQKFLAEIRQTAIPGEKQFRGFDSPVKLWRIPMLDRAKILTPVVAAC